MPNVMADLPNIGGALCSTSQRVTLQRLKFAGVSQTAEPISAASGRKFAILSGHVEEALLFIKFSFLLSIHPLIAKTQSDKFVRWCADGNFLRHLCVLYFQRAACSIFQTCIRNSH